jgi:hypothetical protein
VGWDEAAEVLPVYRELAEEAPRELALGLIIRFAPALPIIPERWHRKPVVLVVACHTGDASRAAGDLAPLRALGRPIVDAVGRRRYVEQQTMFDPSQPKGMHNYWKSEFLPGLTDELLETFRRQGVGMASPMSMLWILQLGGALADHGAMDTPFGNRDADAIFAAAGCWDGDVPEHERDGAWARSAWEALRLFSTGANYVNLQTADADDTRLREGYRDSLDRLARIKATYDPENLFRVNRNIAPAGVASAAHASPGRL